jgi:hypothetical protein
MDPIAIANLLSLLLPLGMKLYDEIQQANTNQLKPLQEILSAADANFDAVIAEAQAELSKVTSTVAQVAAPDPAPSEPAVTAAPHLRLIVPE